MDVKELQFKLNIACWKEEQANELLTLLKPFIKKYPNNVTGDVCKGDNVCYVREIWGGSYRKPIFEGFKIETGTVINDSYGADKQQHTFTIELDNGEKTRIKGRNLYKYIVLAKNRDSEERQVALDEKHKRGAIAREIKARRIELQNLFI